VDQQTSKETGTPEAAEQGTTSRPSEVLVAEGHLVDSQLLTVIFDTVIRHHGAFDVQRFEIGRTNNDFSHLTIKVSASDRPTLTTLIEQLVPLGCHLAAEQDARMTEADQDGCAPEDFYSTTNQRTAVRHGGRWIEVERQRMDGVVVIESGQAICRKLREVRRGDRVVCGVDGVRVSPDFRDRDRFGFAFMTNDISSERRVEVSVAKVAEMIRQAKRTGGRVAFVAGPVVVHTGGGAYFCELIRRGFVDVLLAGNALAVHDVEHALYGTSLGVDLDSGLAVDGGHKHHMRAINAVRRAGGIQAAVDRGVLKSGIMFECVRRNLPYVLAGSIRDDGPLPETMMDLVAAQDRYAALLTDAAIVVMLSSMLHGIGVGNMLPSWVRVVCVDINPAVVTKLMDRGSSQTVGIVTDVGLFLHQLAAKLS
jgi:lysine-ketoglutarate reductase/saccharopine dehydrogenase-like protein (TIGR00300 family)